MDGGTEETPLPDGSVRPSPAGNAMHWFDIARIASVSANVSSSMKQASSS